MRKSQAKKLPFAPDAKYNDILVTRFVNNLMWQGKKNTAFGHFLRCIRPRFKTNQRQRIRNLEKGAKQCDTGC